MTISKPNLRRRIRTIISRTAPLLTLVGLFGLTGVLPAKPVQAAAGINTSINYQGRLLNNVGAVVADGNYNMQFKIYKDGPGNVANDTGGTLEWTEEWLNQAGNGVTVKNGYFSVNLGSITTLVGVDLNQQTLWLSTNIAGSPNTTSVTCTPFSSCTGDGEMLPMRRMASAVYAVNAGSANTCITCILQAPTSTPQNTISPTGATTGLTVNGSATATLAVNVVQGQAADAVDIALSAAGTNANGLLVSRAVAGTTTNGVSVTNATGTTTNGLSVANGATGTTTNGLQLTSTAGGTFSTGINFTGTFGNLIVAPTFSVSNAGAIVGVGVNSGTGLLQTAGGSSINKTLTVNSGGTQNVESITYASPADTAGTNVSQGLNITPAIGNATAGTNTANIINIGAVTGDAQVALNGINIGALTGTAAVETAINIGANWDNVLTVGGTPILNGSGVIQSAGVSGSYSGITGTGALAAGSIASGFGTILTTTTIQGSQFTSTIATGTAPLVVSSTTLVTNLNADMVDGLHAASFQAAGNYLVQAPAATATNTISPTGATTGLTVNGSATATLAVNVLQAQAADGVDVGLSGAGTKPNGVGVTNVTGTTTNGVSVTGGASGTVTNGLQLTSTAGGTFSTGINFTGTFGNLIVAPNFSVSNAGAVAAAASVSTPLLTTAAGDLTIDPTGNTIVKGSTSITGTAALDIQNSSASILYARNDGNIGIQTNAPTSNFQVNQSTTGVGTVTTNGTTALVGVNTQFTNTFKVGDTLTVSGETVRTIATITDDTHLASTVAFSTTAGGLSYTLTGGNRFVVKGNGNVGIGTATPTANLQVTPGVDNAAAFMVQDAAGNSVLTVDSANAILKVFENVASPTNYASISYASGAAIFAASSGITQIGAGVGSGNINLILTGAGDQLLASKTNTPGAPYSLSDFNFTRTITGAGNAVTGNVLKVEDLSTFTTGSSAPNVLYVNQNNASATGNLILAQTGGGANDRFKVTTAGAATLFGGITIGSGSSYTGAGAVTLQSAAATTLTVDSGTTGAVNIGGSANAKTVTIGNTTGASAVTIQGGTGAINIGTQAVVDTVTIGNTTGGSAVTIQGGTGTIAIGTQAVADQITIGNTTGGSAVTFSSGTGGFNIGDDSTTKTINIGGNTNSGTDTVNIATNATAADTITVGNANATTKVTLVGGASAASSGTAGVYIGSPTTDGVQTNLQLDSSSAFADAGTCSATVNQGALYYNTATNAIRSCVNAGWEDVVTTAGLGIMLYGVVADSGTNPGDLISVTTAGVTGPCKVSRASATTVTVQPCTAYSGGRKVVVASAATVTLDSTVASEWEHLCFTATGTLPATLSAATSTETNTTNLPTFSIGNPILCLADIQENAGHTDVQAIHDVRTFTTSIKEFATASTILGLGWPACPNVKQVTTCATATNDSVSGIVVATNGATSATTPNVILSVAGPTMAKTLVTTDVAGDLVGSTAGLANRVSSVTLLTAPTTNLYSNLGISRSASPATACTTTPNAVDCDYQMYFFQTRR